MSDPAKHLEGFQTEFRRYRGLAEKTIQTMGHDQVQACAGGGNNSVEVLMQHLGGNLRSRFTDFLTSDGEKDCRHRDREFEDQGLGEAELHALWNSGWDALEATLGALHAEDLALLVTIRGVEFTVAEALTRALAHVAYHVGQIVLLARLQQGEDWQSLSIPRGGSEAYRQNPDAERGRA
ncbi:MAG: DUF1572 family protein [Planctomycetes bacterium]|nr:DUF1572 family protein [Planctomycetota bacterium]